MEYFDEELLEAKRELERQKHTTLETGIYAGEELITFTKENLPESNVFMYLPEQFVVMPDRVKEVKYPYKNAPKIIITSLDSTVNFAFNILPEQPKDGEIKSMAIQFQTALKNMNPSIRTKNQKDTKTNQGNEMSYFDYIGYHLDGQSYNRIYLIRLKKMVLHCAFSCIFKDVGNWMEIINKMLFALEENL